MAASLVGGCWIVSNSAKLAEAESDSSSGPLSRGRFGADVGETGQLADSRTIHG
jgi:hypothetical protein